MNYALLIVQVAGYTEQMIFLITYSVSEKSTLPCSTCLALPDSYLKLNVTCPEKVHLDHKL